MKIARRLAHLNLGARLGLAFGLVAATILAVVIAGVLYLDRLNTEFARTVSARHAKTLLVHGMVDEFGMLSRAVSNVLLVETPEEIAAEMRAIDAGKRNVGEMLERLNMDAANDLDEERKLLGAV